MNPLTHSKFSIEWLNRSGYRGNANLVILGSVLPDLAYMGFIPERDAHEKSLDFLNYLQKTDPSFAALGIGFLLHGEDPECLDHYTHKQGGYINKKAPPITNLMKRAELKLGKWYPKNEDDFTHSVIEFAGDTLIEDSVAKRLRHALLSVDLSKVAFHLATFFNGEPKRILKALHYFRDFDFGKLLKPRGVAHTIQDFSILQAFSHENNTMRRYNTILNRINPWRTHRLVKLLKDARDIIKEDYHEFLHHVQDKVHKNTTKKIYRVIQ